MGQQYKLYANIVGTTNAAASVKITKKAVIRCIHFDLSATGGAGVGRQSYEVSKQNVSSLSVNDTPSTVLASASLAVGNALTAADNVAIGCAIDVDVGDTIYVNTTLAGTAFATGPTNIYLYT